MGIQQETKKDALNEGGLCCGFSLRALGLVRSPDHFELVGLCHAVASGFHAYFLFRRSTWKVHQMR